MTDFPCLTERAPLPSTGAASGGAPFSAPRIRGTPWTASGGAPFSAPRQKL
jgi:hypothetical protein